LIAPVGKMHPKQATLALLALALATAGAGCSGESAPPVLGLPSPQDAAAESQPSSMAALQSLLIPKDLVVGTPTEVYTRVARGVLTCWFGASGPLKAAYIYHADAQPASRGGSSEIKILTRDSDADDPRALRAYRIAISPSDSKTRVEVENVRIPEPLAARLKQDVERWAGDEAGCGEGPVTAGWTAEQVKAPEKKDKKAPKP
jgi:hypothetical protein